MTDLIFVMDSLVDKNGKILIPNFYNDVAALYENEHLMYDNIHFDVDEYRQEIGAFKLTHNEDKVQLLMHKWRYPSLSMHGIEGAYHEPGRMTVIPSKVTGKFSIRIVPNQTTEKVNQMVCDYINKIYAERGSANRMKVYLADEGCQPFVENPNHPNYTAAKRATKHVYKVDPDMVRSGGSISVTLTLQEATGKSVVMLPVGAADDGAHSQNEKLDVRNYIEGVS